MEECQSWEEFYNNDYIEMHQFADPNGFQEQWQFSDQAQGDYRDEQCYPLYSFAQDQLYIQTFFLSSCFLQKHFFTRTDINNFLLLFKRILIIVPQAQECNFNKSTGYAGDQIPRSRDNNCSHLTGGVQVALASIG